MKVLDLEKLRKFTSDKKIATEFYGRFTAEPFERGYGYTIGNSLRRILLSSLEGSAISSVIITGAMHEFAVLKGVKEDVAQIVLNLKKIRVKLNSDGPERLYLKVKKAGKIIARNIERNFNVEVMNPDQEIANIDNGTTLEIEMEVTKGKGYVLAEELKIDKCPVGTIFLDSLYSPVAKVNYEVENTRVEQILNYDRLVMEVWTDGSVAPKDALIKSAKILRNSLVIFTNDPIESEEIIETQVENNLAKESDIYNQLISIMELSTRVSNSLKKAGIEKIGDLVQIKEDDLIKFDNFGKRSFEEIKSKIQEFGLSLGMEFKNGVKK
ncbi:MAG: DNA-directed RNA polymerase subunit alpha [Endomicrobium sp.]|jgi:DNA-directed RNA polymerase subunit alpha|nr:DNA-directed RNA polymerase subunit alpha [Endomicrobium sp.]